MDTDSRPALPSRVDSEQPALVLVLVLVALSVVAVFLMGA